MQTSSRGRFNANEPKGRPRRSRRQRPSSAKPTPAKPEPSVFDQIATTATESKPFDELGLATPILKVLANQGITEAFPIQAATIPDALAGHDVLGRAQTGSGKTLAFGLPLLNRLDGAKARPLHPRGLILVPTRELAMQVNDALTPLAKSLGLWVRPVVGGMSFGKQADGLRRGVDLLVATPGRLSDHVRQGTCVLDEIQMTAIDEADQMADMGFLPQVREILDLIPAGGQRMLFSATLDRDVDQLIRQYLHEPVVHTLAPSAASVDTMDHHQLMVSAEDKNDVIARIAAREGRTILFVRTKHNADRLTKKLRSVGVPAGALHGGKAQNARSRILSEFRDGSTQALVATNVAARGIHVDDVSMVVHVDPPLDPKDYLHRAGRTARAGASGTVVMLVTDGERRAARAMTQRAGVQTTITKVHSTDEELARITGAREPSGVPVVEAPAPTKPRDGKRNGGFGRRASERGDGPRSGRPGRGGGRFADGDRPRRPDHGGSAHRGGQVRGDRRQPPRRGVPRHS